ncbi:21906_t:CDS:2, partial [Racocetra persica]
DIFKIIVDYRKENETEIKKSVASLGKRDEENINIDGGGELQIVINRKDLERYSTSYYDGRGMRISCFWINSGEKGSASAYDDYQIGFTPTPGSNSDLPDREVYFPKRNNDKSPILPQPSPKNNQLTDTEKQQILQYFLQNGIQKITIENGKLIITHNNNNTIVTDEDSEQQKYHQILEKLPTQTLSLSELQNNNTNSNSNKDDKNFYKGLVVGAVVSIHRESEQLQKTTIPSLQKITHFTPHLDLGNYVVLINARHISFTGNKLDNKNYYNHSGYSGGLRTRSTRSMLEKYPTELVFRIIRGMMPHNKLGDKQATRLFIFADEEMLNRNKQKILQAQEKNFIKIDLELKK